VSLDEPASFVPVDHVWMEDALPWDRPGDGLLQHSKSRPDELSEHLQSP